MGKGRGMLDGLRKSKKQKEAEKGAAAEKQERDQKRADEKVEEQTLSYQRHSDRPPNTLRITVIRAKDLQVMDGGMFSKGGSDPFPTCAVEGKKAKGTVKKKCLAPIWLEVFDLPAEDPDSVFTFQIDDHDLVGASDFMGLCRVRLGSLSDEKAHRKWHPLGNVKGEVDEIPRGEVELCLRWCHEKHRAYELPKEFKEGEKPLHEKEAANELHVLLIRARDLEVKDGKLFGPGSSDPLVTFDLGGSKQKSTVKKKELNPVWQETFIFTCEDESATLHCTLDDYDPLSGNDFMGLASVPVRTLANRKIHRGWHKLGPAKGKDDKGKKRGRLEMALRWKHNPSLVIPLCAELLKPELNMMKPKNELEIFLIRGAGRARGAARARGPTPPRAGLKIMDKNLLSKGGSSDPLMKFELCGETATSTTKKKDLNPQRGRARAARARRTPARAGGSSTSR
ncbi:Protein kinase C conserved region 2 (CalB) [Aureococcus anophagefferens]|uniref:Protein kinase C conserved region 2 (CalB) n=1 Tax=Aureococcus anophagefferens TaxID=44056 RepID=A0ABR1GAI7_AURAN